MQMLMCVKNIWQTFRWTDRRGVRNFHGNDRSQTNVQSQRIALVRATVCTLYGSDLLGSLAVWRARNAADTACHRCAYCDYRLLPLPGPATTILPGLDVFGDADRLGHFASFAVDNLLSAADTDWDYNAIGRL